MIFAPTRRRLCLDSCLVLIVSVLPLLYYAGVIRTDLLC